MLRFALWKLFELIQEFLVVRNAFLDKPNHTAIVDEVGNPSPTVEFLDRFIFVGNKREIDAVLRGEFSMCFQAVRADPDYLCIRFFEFFQITLEGNELIGSDRRKRCEIKRQHNVFLSRIIY